MDQTKLDLIRTVMSQTAGKQKNDLAPVLFSLITNAQKRNIKFSPDEFTLIMQIFKEGKTKEEIVQIDKTINMVRSLLKV